MTWHDGIAEMIDVLSVVFLVGVIGSIFALLAATLITARLKRPVEEREPETGESLEGCVADCWKCGADFPAADRVIRGEGYCPKCREK